MTQTQIPAMPNAGICNSQRRYLRCPSQVSALINAIFLPNFNKKNVQLPKYISPTGKNISPTGKKYFSNWKKIFLQLEKIFSLLEEISPSTVGMNALKGQRAHSPGQSEATPWVCMPRKQERPARAKAQWLQSITLLPLQGVYRNNI